MSEITLTWDQQKHLFSLPVMIQVAEKTGIGTIINTKNTQTVMYLDTGSNLTSITEEELDKLEIAVDSLPKVEVSGIGGFTQMPRLKNVNLLLLDKNTIPVQLKLDEIGVTPANIVKVREKKKGVYKRTSTTVRSMLSLLGIDAVIKLKGVIELDMVNLKGKINF